MNLNHLTEEQINVIEKVMRRFNEAPLGFKKVSKKEFWKFAYTKDQDIELLTIYKQILPQKPLKKTIMASFKIYRDFTGYAIEFVSEKKQNFYVFGCQHDFVNLTMQQCLDRNIPHFGNCYHVRQCRNCEYFDTQDTTG